ncbi:MAG: hypothetical protein Rubg2KO_34930 [Rubricoccaceae bacterium]
MPRPGVVYILASKPNGTLYIGVTSDLAQRMADHRAGEASTFTAEYGVDHLVYVERHEDIQDAIVREKRLKKWRRAWKLRLIREQNPTWRDLADDLERQPGERAALNTPRMGPRLRGDDSLGENHESHVESRPSECSSGRWKGRILALIVGLFVLAGCGEDNPHLRLAEEGPETLVGLAVEVNRPADDDTLDVVKATFQTDKAGAVWYDALASPQDDPAMGFTVDGERVLDGWRWWMDADSVVLGADDFLRGVARPDVAIRSYMERDTTGLFGRILKQVQGDRPSRLSERITLLDERGALLVEVADSVGIVGFQPIRSDRAAAGDYAIQEREGALLFARVDRVVPDSLAASASGPIWTAVVAEPGLVRSTSAASATPRAGRDAAFRLGELAIETPSRIVIATGPTPAAADSAARDALANAIELRNARSDRLDALVQSVPFDTADETYDAAFRWSVLSLDALVRSDSGRATIAAGLPGAEPETYPAAAWTFGAFLDTGRWDLARTLLTTYGDQQLFDRRTDLLGRAPDLVTAEGEARFLTADATPLFLAAAGETVRTTGDRQLVQGAEDFWFKTVFALRGIYEDDSRNGNATTDPGFLIARNRRTTWLDANADRGGLERRGAPAEAQGALYRALATATDFAEIMGVSQRSSASWYADTSAVLVQDVAQRFERNGLVVDRIDGSPARDVRPGGLLALALMDAFPDRAAHARRLAEQLVLPYGVASLAPGDSTFHPYITAPEFYATEAGRTQGAVWTWLAGPVATLMAETGGHPPAAELMDAQARLLLDRGVIGALPMLTDGHPREENGLPRAGGAPVQPWSLAGFLRATYQGFLGAHYADAQTLALEPRLPESWGETSATMTLNSGSVAFRLEPQGDGLRAVVTPSGVLAPGSTLRLRAAGRQLDLQLVDAQSDTLTTSRAEMTVELTSRGAEVNGESVETTEIESPDSEAWDGFAFVAPEIPDEYPVMRIVESQRSLGGDEILRTNARARLRLIQTDPDGDDWGPTSTFTYPTGWPDGTLDAIGLELAQDDSTTYIEAEFRVVAPQSELGHPAAFAAIVIDTEPGGERRVGRDALYDYPRNEGYEYIIYAGRGLLIEDGRGRELGRLEASVFDPQSGLLSFALPRFILPELARGTTLTLLVGALDPDGGVGSFRQVARQATRNVGGGRVDPGAANVYDVIVGTVR